MRGKAEVSKELGDADEDGFYADGEEGGVISDEEEESGALGNSSDGGDASAGESLGLAIAPVYLLSRTASMH